MSPARGMRVAVGPSLTQTRGGSDMTIWKASTMALTAAMAMGIGSSAIGTAEADPQPTMVAALERLNGAKQKLEAAQHDKGGHRAKALQLTNDAIEEVKKGIAFDN